MNCSYNYNKLSITPMNKLIDWKYKFYLLSKTKKYEKSLKFGVVIFTKQKHIPKEALIMNSLKENSMNFNRKLKVNFNDLNL